MTRLSGWWRSFRRGYKDEDVASMRRKLARAREKPPGSVTYLTSGEAKAMLREIPAAAKAEGESR